MLNNEWKSLKNGSDIRGIAVESENGSINLTDEAVTAIAYAFGPVSREGASMCLRQGEATSRNVFHHQNLR